MRRVRSKGGIRLQGCLICRKNAQDPSNESKPTARPLRPGSGHRGRARRAFCARPQAGLVQLPSGRAAGRRARVLGPARCPRAPRLGREREGQEHPARRMGRALARRRCASRPAPAPPGGGGGCSGSAKGAIAPGAGRSGRPCGWMPSFSGAGGMQGRGVLRRRRTFLSGPASASPPFRQEGGGVCRSPARPSRTKQHLRFCGCLTNLWTGWMKRARELWRRPWRGNVRAGGGAVLAAPSGAGAGRLRAMLEGAGLGWEELVVKGPVPVQAGQGQGGAEGAAVGTGAEDGEREDSGGTRARLGAKLAGGGGPHPRGSAGPRPERLPLRGCFSSSPGRFSGLPGAARCRGPGRRRASPSSPSSGSRSASTRSSAPNTRTDGSPSSSSPSFPPGRLPPCARRPSSRPPSPGSPPLPSSSPPFGSSRWPSGRLGPPPSASAASRSPPSASGSQPSSWARAAPPGCSASSSCPWPAPSSFSLPPAAFALFGASVFGASVFAAGGGGFAACLLLLAAAACFYLPLCLKGAALALQAAVR